MKKLICLLAAVMLLLTGCAQQKESTVPELLEPVGVKADTAVVTRGDLFTTMIYEGSVVAAAEELSFEISGTISAVNVYPGMWVEEGDVLIELDQSDLEKKIEAVRENIDYMQTNGAFNDELARLNTELLRTELAHLKAAEVPDQTAIALKELDIEQAELSLRQTQELRELDLQSLRTDLAVLEVDYNRNTIVAPFSGHVFYEGNIVTGQWVQADKAVAYIANPDDLTMVIKAHIPEGRLVEDRYYARIGGGRYSVAYEAMDQNEMVSMLLSGKTMETHFRVTGPEELLSDVHAGDYAVLCVEGVHHEDVLMIPLGAVYSSTGTRYVYVQNAEGEREHREVKVGLSNTGMIEITEGLEEGEIVYVKE